jgi:BirA family transcriptional regulator, biotin operon repressor / biotin---[acetyl-CoA-carboxylase] ligase
MAFALGPKAHAAGYRLATYESVGSTSVEALAWARLGDPGKLWVVAKAQTSGHGRRGRAWQTPVGNLAASLMMRESDLGSAAATLGFAVGLALESAISAVARAIPEAAPSGDTSRQERLGLKWPNDVLCDGAKVAGILLEAVTMAGSPSSVVIGIGVNVLRAPEGIPYPATSLAACGIAMTAETLFEALGEAWVEQVAAWNAGLGFADIRDRWLQHAVGVGGPISVKVGDDVVSGTFETIDLEGRLIVRAGDGTARPISAGEVHFGTAASARH